MKFEENMKRLEEIAVLLEKGDTPIEELIKLYEEGSKLAAQCYSVLKKSEQKVKTLKAFEENLS
ncbi:MAG: exodeoxyribonuclease VII small subunit [Oscillospiraceae bacterium]|jgi:exodeoxyribonuclease VII small subunit|nr:exodeoxyribonuclease VII small subunit [Oscillospiraceae bacterium]